MTNEFLFVVHFKPKAELVDLRGVWAKNLSAQFDVPAWAISLDGVEVRDTDDDVKHQLRAFVDIKQCGVHMRDVEKPEEFTARARQLLNFLFRQPEFGSQLFVLRIGVRLRSMLPFSGTFNELKVRYSTRYATVTPDAMAAIGEDAEIKDIGMPLVFEDRIGRCNTMSGPMEQEQAKAFFANRIDIPKVGLYFDNDYHRRPDREVKSSWLEQFISESASEGWLRLDRIKQLILGESKRGQEERQVQFGSRPHIPPIEGTDIVRRLQNS